MNDGQADDLQLEFVMLNPYIRQNLTYVEEHDNGDYSTVDGGGEMMMTRSFMYRMCTECTSSDSSIRDRECRSSTRTRR